MKLDDVRDIKDYFTEKLSEVSRNLSFAGIAVVWIFVRTSPDGSINLPQNLNGPLLLFVGALAADLFHYMYASVAWSIFHRKMELTEDKVRDFQAPREINWPTNLFFYGKALLTCVGYVFLFSSVWVVISE